MSKKRDDLLLTALCMNPYVIKRHVPNYYTIMKKGRANLVCISFNDINSYFKKNCMYFDTFELTVLS